jgi:L-lactate dehydrogenase complex protein LldG
MSARTEMLASVRRALGTSHGRRQPVPRGYRNHTTTADLVRLFVDRVEDYKATVARCDAAAVADHIGAVLGPGNRVMVPDGFGYRIPGAVTDTGLTATELDATDAVVTTAAVAIAATGTIVLDHGPGQGRRALSLIPDLHVCVVREDQIVDNLPQAVPLLDPNRPQTWISGPSATSDIELDRVEGVHGPRKLHVIVATGGH